MTTVDDDAQHTDAELVRRFQRATDPAVRNALYDELLRRYQQRLHAFCLWRLQPDRDAGEEAAAATLREAWRALDGLRDPHKLKPWLFAVARRRCEQQHRRRRPGPAPVAWEDLDGPAMRLRSRGVRRLAEADAAFAARRDAALRLVERIAATLPDPKRRLLHRLYAEDGLRGAALAKALGVPVGKAYADTKRHKEALHRAFTANVVAKDGRNRRACARLDGILGAAEQEDLEVRRALRDPAGFTEALPRALCERVTRHIAQCGVCGGHVSRSRARWTPVVVPLLFAEELRKTVREDFALVSHQPPGAAPGLAPHRLVQRVLVAVVVCLVLGWGGMQVFGGGVAGGEAPVRPGAPSSPVNAPSAEGSRVPGGPPRLSGAGGGGEAASGQERRLSSTPGASSASGAASAPDGPDADGADTGGTEASPSAPSSVPAGSAGPAEPAEPADPVESAPPSPESGPSSAKPVPVLPPSPGSGGLPADPVPVLPSASKPPAVGHEAGVVTSSGVSAPSTPSPPGR